MGASDSGIFHAADETKLLEAFITSLYMNLCLAIFFVSISSAALRFALPLRNDGIFSCACRGFNKCWAVKRQSAMTISPGLMCFKMPHFLKS